jgi:3-deoxy-D-manno-octulosonic-acid transferase
MFWFLYDLFYACAFLIFLPFALWQAIRSGKYRRSSSSRFGFGCPRVVRKEEGPIFWIHAVSVGETVSIAPLAKMVKEIPNSTLIVSSITETGHAEAARSIPFADEHLFAPFDFYPVVRYVLSRIQPDVVILSETDLWGRFLFQAKKQGATIFVASGKISERSYRRYRWCPFFAKKLFSLVDFFCVQSELIRKRLSALGVPSEKIAVTGNSKSDVSYWKLTPQELSAWREKLGITRDDFVVVVGSSHDPEEAIILRELAPLLAFGKLKLILVPRHPERFREVFDLATKTGFLAALKSNLQPSAQIIVIDEMGALTTCYQLADLAIVAGSFTERVGGHNILEPLFFGIPTLCGPYMKSQQQLFDIAQEFHAIARVRETDLYTTVKTLLDNPEERRTLSLNGLRMIESLHGVTERTLAQFRKVAPHLFPSLKTQGSPL